MKSDTVEENEFVSAQRDRGARFISDLPEQAARRLSGSPEWAPLALDFGDSAAEYAAAKQTAAVFDLSDRTQIEVTGSDRVEFLHNFCTNDIKKLSPGEGCEAFVTSVKGRVLGHVFVFAGPQSLWIDSVPGQQENLLAHLERYIITDDVVLAARTDEWPTLFVSGPSSEELLSQCGIPAADMGLGDNRLVEESFGVARVDWLDQPGFVLGLPKDRMREVWNRVTEAGIRPAGAAAFHTLRIEAAFPWYGIDVTDGNLPQEVARTERAISFTKGCYLGQEPIARLDAMGHVNRELRGLRLATGPMPSPDSAIRNVDDGAEIGSVTSAARISDDAPPVALGYLRSQYVQHGTNVTVDVDGIPISATVFREE